MLSWQSLKVTKLSQFELSKFFTQNQKLLLVSCGCFAVFLLLSTCVAAWQTLLVTQSLKQQEIATAALYSNNAQKAVFPIRIATLFLIPDLEAWSTGLKLVTTANEIRSTAPKSISELFASDTAAASYTQLETHFKETLRLIKQLQKQLDNSVVISYFVKPSHYALLTQTQQSVTTLFESFQTSHKIVVLLQNSDEIRATGGFIGTIAIVEFTPKQPITFEVRDIYQPDGQFTGFIQAPAGVHEYLSGGKGWRLPDANWSPDFPTSSQDISRFLAAGGVTGITDTVAINLRWAEQMLRIIGPISLPDYNTTVTHENIAEIARSDRSTFFAGSYQKPQFFQQLFTQLKLKLPQLSSAQQKSLATLTIDSLKRKEIQLHATTPSLENLYTNLQVAGKRNPTNDQEYVLQVESNVGINKVNRFVEREVQVIWNPNRTQVATTFTNKSTTDHYANYHRFFLLPDTKVETLSINGQPTNEFNTDLITFADGTAVRQVGILMPTLASSSANVVLDFSHPVRAKSGVFVDTQAGVPTTVYTFKLLGETKTISVDKPIAIK